MQQLRPRPRRPARRLGHPVGYPSTGLLVAAPLVALLLVAIVAPPPCVQGFLVTAPSCGRGVTSFACWHRQSPRALLMRTAAAPPAIGMLWEAAVEESGDSDGEDEDDDEPLDQADDESEGDGSDGEGEGQQRRRSDLFPETPGLLGSRSLGIDWGHKKIGVAVSAGFSQRPLGTIPNAGGTSANATRHQPTLDHILALVRAEGAVRVVMGNPLFRDGTLSPQANSTRNFARLLANRAVELGMMPPDEAQRTPFVCLWDERLTSQAARVNIKNKDFMFSSSDVDSQAACLVLEDFYQAKAYKAQVVWPDPDVAPLASAPQAAPASASATAGAGASGSLRRHMSYDEWRRAEREKYETGWVNQQEAAEGSAAKKKKKKKKKR